MAGTNGSGPNGPREINGTKVYTAKAKRLVEWFDALQGAGRFDQGQNLEAATTLVVGALLLDELAPLGYVARQVPNGNALRKFLESALGAEVSEAAEGAAEPAKFVGV